MGEGEVNMMMILDTAPGGAAAFRNSVRPTPDRGDSGRRGR